MNPLAVAIVSYETRQALDRCLTALRTALPPGADVVVVDNASSDGSAEMVAREHGWARLLALEENRGFAAGVNAALAASDAPLVLVLNPDVEVNREGIDRLLAAADRDPAPAGVAPLLVGADGRPQTGLYRRAPTRAQIVLFWTLLALLARRVPTLRRRWLEHDLRSGGILPVDQLPGGAMLLSRAAIERVGTLDEGYFMWFEDVDWSCRARQAGHELLVDTHARFRHEGGASFRGWGLDRRLFQFYRAGLRFLAKHASPCVRALAVALIPRDFALRSALLVAARRGSLLHARESRAAIRRVAREIGAGRVPDFTGPGPDDMTLPGAPAEARP